MVIRVFLFATVFVLLAADSSTRADVPTKAEILFALKVDPILRNKCLGCHGENPDELESGFDVRSRESILLGGDAFGGEVLIPGDADGSSLHTMIRRAEEGYEMPPKEADKLTAAEIEAIRAWIEGGAPWPDEKRVAEIYKDHADGITWQTRGGLSDEWTNRKYKREDLWAYQPVERPEIPSASDSDSVDFFIDRKLDSIGLNSAPVADRTTLIRRATFDLIGLPPSPDQVRQFVNDSQSDAKAFADLVDRLLESPHYGEQWGRHWLDVVRYADSSGFANDWERPNAWRYRDYVVRAFNDDKPYDEFVREQIAGDEMAARMAEDDPKKVESVIAAGFLRMGPWEHTGMSVAKVTRQMFLDDVTDSVGQVFLGHSLQCARCHDHKFDPVPTQDYYAMQAVFATTQFAEIDTPWLPAENLDGMDEDRRYHKMRIEANKKVLADVTRQKTEAERKWLEERNLPFKSATEAKRANAPPEQVPPTSELLRPEVFGQERIGRKWQQRFPWEMDRYRPIAFTVYNGKTHHGKHSVRLVKPDDPMKQGSIERTAILTGGSPFAAADPVEPAVLSAVSTGRAFAVPSEPNGRRIALANWIVDPENPLTARVMVNRIWQYHFGRGIAGNSNNFGVTGKKPMHPDLLDWLASEFVDNKWSVKHLHRIIMSSAAYMRSGFHSDGEKLREIDPEQSSCAAFVPRRLTAEELRDTMLTVSDELNRTIGGIPVRPDMNLEAALQPRMIMGTFAPSYVPNPKPKQRNRRTIYALKLRGHRDPFMETFNQPGTDKSCELRDSSTVSPQALTLFNSEETADRALAFANEVLKTTESDEDAVDRAFWLAYSRSPSSGELAETLTHWRKMTTVQESITPTRRTYPTEVARRAVDENTGEPFEFREPLFAYEDYQPDVQPHDVDAKTRAFGDVCLAIINSNEFVYVY